MAENLEIERKFLVIGDDWRAGASSHVIRQGYILTSETTSLRVRLLDDKGFLTVKSDLRELTRHEFEYEIPVEDAVTLLDRICPSPKIEKVRHIVEFGGMTWEIDEFTGLNSGLIVAELELTAPDQGYDRPLWIGPEVSAEPQFLNAQLVNKPFCEWGITYAELLSSHGR